MTQEKIPFLIQDNKKLVEKVLIKSGYMSYYDADACLIKEAEKSVKKIIERIKCESIYKTSHIINYNKEGIHGDGLVIKSRKLSSLLSKLHNVQTICCFAVTLGPAVDELIRKTMKQSVTGAFLMDIAGSVLVENLASQGEDYLHKRNAEKNLAGTARFSPGYCDWEIQTGQDAIFNFIDPGSIGISKLSSGMMTPEKSVTAIIISARQVSYQTPCTLCSKKGCVYRRDKNRKK